METSTETEPSEFGVVMKNILWQQPGQNSCAACDFVLSSILWPVASGLHLVWSWGAIFEAFSGWSGSITFLSIYSPLCFANDTKVFPRYLLL